jgi:hypothetical protein
MEVQGPDRVRRGVKPSVGRDLFFEAMVEQTHGQACESLALGRAWPDL